MAMLRPSGELSNEKEEGCFRDVIAPPVYTSFH